MCTIDANWPCQVWLDEFTWHLHLKTICWRLIFQLHSGISFSCRTKILPNVSPTSSPWGFWFFFDKITNLNVVVAMLIALWSSLFCQSKFLGCFSRRKFCFNIGWAIILIICITVFSVEWKHRLKILNFCRTSKGLNRLHQLQLHWISSSQSFVFHPCNNFSDWWFCFQFVLQ